MLKLKSHNIKDWKGCRTAATFTYCRMGHKMAQLFWKIWQFLIKLNTYSVHDPEIALLHIYPKEMYVHTKICLWIFTAAVFIIAKRL
jgi:hypothetical protein